MLAQKTMADAGERGRTGALVRMQTALGLDILFAS